MLDLFFLSYLNGELQDRLLDLKFELLEFMGF